MFIIDLSLFSIARFYTKSMFKVYKLLLFDKSIFIDSKY